MYIYQGFQLSPFRPVRYCRLLGLLYYGCNTFWFFFCSWKINFWLLHCEVVFWFTWHCVCRMVALMSPDDSWVAKWQRISKSIFPTWLFVVRRSQMLSHIVKLCLHFSLILFIFADRCVPGVYALSVTGKLSNSIVRDLRSQGVGYRSRDTSQKS